MAPVTDISAVHARSALATLMRRKFSPQTIEAPNRLAAHVVLMLVIQ
jgi:hypothetical protein